jgi:hypothetical protein
MMEEITQDTATLNLMMHREVDKRVMLALHRALDPVANTWRAREIERAYDSDNMADIQKVVRSMLIEAIMSDGSLMHQIRSKIGESLQRSPY